MKMSVLFDKDCKAAMRKNMLELTTMSTLETSEKLEHLSKKQTKIKNPQKIPAKKNKMKRRTNGHFRTHRKIF